MGNFAWLALAFVLWLVVKDRAALYAKLFAQPVSV